jgi:hypothetical protein
LERTRFAHGRHYFDDETAATLIRLCARTDRALRALRNHLWTVERKHVPYNRPAPRPDSAKKGT